MIVICGMTMISNEGRSYRSFPHPVISNHRHFHTDAPATFLGCYNKLINHVKNFIVINNLIGKRHIQWSPLSGVYVKRSKRSRRTWEGGRDSKCVVDSLKYFQIGKLTKISFSGKSTSKMPKANVKTKKAIFVYMLW